MKNNRWMTKTESGLLILSALFLCLMVGILYQTGPRGEKDTYSISVQADDRESLPEEAAPLNINTATVEQLETLSGIGPVLAERIVAEREENGLFSSVEDLKRVSGIGDKTLEEIRGEITVDVSGEEGTE